jgi:hypothetical protein
LTLIKTIMNRYSLPRTILLGMVALIAAGCGNDPTVAPDNSTKSDTTRVMTSFALQAFAGTAPFSYNAVMTSETGAQYKVSTLRFYLSQFLLIDSSGANVAATLCDSAGTPLKYDVAFCDFAKPETQSVHLLAPKGSYRGVIFSIGVPNTTPGGAPLNHADASQQTYPLDVDNDMYWGWNPGYVFFKIEGSVLLNGTWTSLVYHIGGDTRLMTTRLDVPFTIAKSGDAHTLALNTNRLFVTPSGSNAPDITGAISDRVVHGGSPADSMALNVAKSGFITFRQ